jgi:putative transposase
MPNYRRAFLPGSWFFTVNLLQRHNNDLLIREIGSLRETVKWVRDATLLDPIGVKHDFSR